MFGWLKRWRELRRRRSTARSQIEALGYFISRNDLDYRCWTCNEKEYDIRQSHSTKSLAGEVFYSRSDTNHKVCLRCTAITRNGDRLNLISVHDWCQAHGADKVTLDAVTYRMLPENKT